MYWLVRRWTGSTRAAAFAGVAFVFNGMMLNCLMWSNYVASYGWMPWTVLWVERAWREGGRKRVPAVLAASMQMLSGTPEIVLFTWLLLTGMFAGTCLFPVRIARTLAPARERFKPAVAQDEIPGEPIPPTYPSAGAMALRFMILVSMVALICAAQLLPFLEFLIRSQRHAEFGTGEWSMPAWGWVNLILPLFHTFPAHQGVHFQSTQFWTSSYYPGIAVIALAIWGILRGGSRRAWALGAATVACLLLALGESAGIYALFRKWVPGSGFMRFPIKFVLLAAFLWPCLAAFGVAAWERHEADRRGIRGMVLLVLGLAAAVGALMLIAWQRPSPDEVVRATLWNGAGRILCLVATIAAVGGSLAARNIASPRPWKRTLLHVLPMLLVWLDVMTHAPSQNPTAGSWTFDKDVQQMRQAPRLGEGRMMISAEARKRIRTGSIDDPSRDFVFKRQALFDNCNLPDGFPSVDGMYSLFIREHDAIRSMLFGSGDAMRPRLMDFLGVKWTTAPGELIQWSPRPTAHPLVTAGQAIVITNAAAAVESMAAPDWNPLRTAFALTNSHLPAGTFLGDQVKVMDTSWSTHRVTIEVEGSAPASVVISQTWDPHWRATLNGTAAPVARVNHAFQAVQVPAGKSRIELSYVNSWFRVGCGLSLFGWVALWCWRVRQKCVQTPATF